MAMNTVSPPSTFRVCCKAGPQLYLAIRKGQVAFAKEDANDLTQFWIKIDYPNVRDVDGFPAFALVNWSTNQAIQQTYALSGNRLLLLLPTWSETMMDKTFLWTFRKDNVLGYRVLRTLKNYNLCVDATWANDNRNSVDEKSSIYLHNVHGLDNQRWQLMVDYVPGAQIDKPMRMVCRANPGLNLAVRDGTLLLADASHEDLNQKWIKVYSKLLWMTDKEGRPSFVLVNKGTGQAIKPTKQAVTEAGVGYQLELVPFDNNADLDKVDEALWWTEAVDNGSGFHNVRMAKELNMCFRCLDKRVADGAGVALWPAEQGSANSDWKIVASS